MDEETLLWSAGRDFALMRRCANPQVPQTETFSNIALLRRLLLEGAIHNYWKHLRPSEAAKFQIEYSAIRIKDSGRNSRYLLVLTGDQWSDLLVGGFADCVETPSNIHAGMTFGKLSQHIESSIVLAHDEFSFTPSELIKYHAYVLGEVHLNAKEERRIKAYDEFLRREATSSFISFGNNGPSSLALKGIVNRITRSDAFQHMFAELERRGFIPNDVAYPGIDPYGLRDQFQQSAYDMKAISLRWTQRAVATGMASAFPYLNPPQRIIPTDWKPESEQDR